MKEEPKVFTQPGGGGEQKKKTFKRNRAQTRNRSQGDCYKPRRREVWRSFEKNEEGEKSKPRRQKKKTAISVWKVSSKRWNVPVGKKQTAPGV